MWQPAIRTISSAALIGALVLLVPPAPAMSQGSFKQTVVQTLPFVAGNTATFWSVFMAYGQSDNAVTVVQIPMPVAGTFSNLRAYSRAALTGAQTRTVALYVNGAASTPTVTMNAANQGASDTVNTATVAAGDTVALRGSGTNSPAANTVVVTYDFQATSGTNVSIYALGGIGDVLGTAPTRSPLISVGEWNADDDLGCLRIPVAGSFTAMRLRLNNAPGVGNTRTFALTKNSTPQDGGGGTTDTRVTFGAADTVQSATFSASYTAGNTVCVRHTTTGTPTNTHRATGAVAYSGSEAAWMMGFQNGNGPTDDTLDEYQYAHAAVSPAWNTTEADHVLVGGVSTLWLARLRVDIGTAPGSGNSWTFTVRKNSTDQSRAVSLGDASTAGTDLVDRVQIALGDTYVLKATPASVPANASRTNYTFAAYNTDPGSGAGGGGGFNALLIVGLSVAARRWSVRRAP
jgi:hypothetical protein